MALSSALQQDSSPNQEFNLTGADFRFIRELVAERTGIMLSENKRGLVYGRLSRRLRELGMQKFRDYCDLLQSGDDEEMVNFVNAITTNLTSFFRENHHFEFLGKELLPRLINQKMKENSDRRLRIWSAGCSTGEEPYSIAMVLKEVLGDNPNWDVKILATDLDTKVLAKASSGIYDQSRVEGLSKTRLRNWVKRGSGENEGNVLMSRKLRNLITFKQLNLMEEWPIKGPFDLIFCRNVVIYFNKPTQQILFDRYADLLADDGHLFLGHSETMFQKTDRFKLIGKTIYYKES